MKDVTISYTTNTPTMEAAAIPIRRPRVMFPGSDAKATIACRSARGFFLLAFNGVDELVDGIDVAADAHFVNRRSYLLARLRCKTFEATRLCGLNIGEANMNTLNRLTAAIGAAAIAFSFCIAPSLAQGTADERSACMSDAFTFCSAVIPDVDKITACLKENVSRLTPACQAEFQQGGRTKIKSSHFNR